MIFFWVAQKILRALRQPLWVAQGRDI